MYVKIKNNDVFKTKSINGNPFKALVRERERERERESQGHALLYQQINPTNEMHFFGKKCWR
jgi:hypothetical protein